MLAEAVAVAAMHWPASPCHGRERVVLVSVAKMDRVSTTPRSWGWAIGPRCTVLVALQRVPHASTRYLCRMLVHEFGHLAGLEHTSDPRDVMNHKVRDIRADTPDCWKLTGAR